MRILALDPATTTGWALFDGSSISEVGFITFSPVAAGYSGTSEGLRLLEAHRWLDKMIVKWKPDLIVAEGFFASGRFTNGSNVNHEIRGIFKMTAACLEKQYVVTGPSEWKRKLCGRTTPTKAEKKLYGKANAKKMVTVKALEARGFKFPEKVRSAKGNMVKWKFDISDALGILVAELDARAIDFQIHPDLFQVEPKS